MKKIKNILVLCIIITMLVPYASFAANINNKSLNENKTENKLEEKNENNNVTAENNTQNTVEGKDTNEINSNVVNNTVENKEENVVENTLKNEVENVASNSVNNTTKNDVTNTITNEVSNVVTNEISNTVENVVDNEIVEDDEMVYATAVNEELSVEYQTHIENIGWQDSVSDGEMAGTEGLGFRLEAIKINIKGNSKLKGGVKFQTYVENIGWQDSVENPINEKEKNLKQAGTMKQGLRIEAIKISLTEELEKEYDIYYRVHAQNIGWLGWAKNGELSGTTRYGYRLEAIQIKIQKKDKNPPVSGKILEAYKENTGIKYQTHVENIGWQSAVYNGKTSGTSGQGLRLEAIKINMDTEYIGEIEYSTHIENIGWQDGVSDGEMSGTSGLGYRLEAIKIKLSKDSELDKKYDVYYRVHAQNLGWLDWAKNGEMSGTEGYGYRLEAIEIVLVEKGKDAPGKTSLPYMKKYIGSIHIDLPKELQKFTVPSKDDVSPCILNLDGWAVSDDENATLTVQIDGKDLNTKITRYLRKDITVASTGKSKAEIENTKLAGFKAELNIGDLKEGKHWVSVIQTDRYGQYVYGKGVTIDVELPRYDGKIKIDSPTDRYEVNLTNKESDTVEFRGWAISEDKDAIIRVYFDNELWISGIGNQVVSRYERKDVNKTSVKGWDTSLEKTKNSGYVTVLTFGNNIIPGIHTVKIEQVSRFGHVICEKSVNINIVNDNYNYTGKLCIDNPINMKMLVKARNDSFKIDGWAISDDSEAKVQIYIDGGLFDSNCCRTYRQDINVQVLPNNELHIKHTANAGFTTTELSVNVLGLSEGIHTITVKQIDRRGRVIAEKSVNIRVISKIEKGVDVSKHNDVVDWESVVRNGFSFAILRVGYGQNSSQKDEKFEYNYNKCRELGILVGAYLYSYAMDPDNAEREANNCLNWLAGRPLDLPVYFDLENTTAGYPQHTLSRETQTEMVIRFCDRIQSAGYRAGLYASKSWMQEHLDMSRIEGRYSIWIAHYTDGKDKVFYPATNPSVGTDYYGKYNMWQYSPNGSISGNNHPFDFNIFYY